MDKLKKFSNHDLKVMHNDITRQMKHCFGISDLKFLNRLEAEMNRRGM